MADKVWYLTGPSPKAWPAGNEPRHATTIGTPEHEAFAIYLGNESMNSLDRAIAEASQQPVVGLLLGYPLRSSKRPFILVTGLLLAPLQQFNQEPVEKSSLFSTTSLEQLESLWNKQHPHECVVGWFHGFPGREALQLTPYEHYTHQRFFTAPWQIALLIDTEEKTSSLYRWQDDELIPSDSFYYWNSTHEPVNSLIVTTQTAQQPTFENNRLENEDESEDPSLTDEPPESSKHRWLLIPLLIAAFYFLVSGGPGSVPWVRAQRVQHELQLIELQHELMALREKEADLEYLAAEWKANIEDTLASALQGVTPDSPDTLIEVISSPSPAPAGTNMSNGTVGRFEESVIEAENRREYVIQVGDTMWNISAIFLGDPYSFRALAEENNIADPDLIYPGQRIQLP